MRSLVLAAAAGAFLAPAALHAELPAEAPAGIVGYRLARPALAVGGAPTRAALEELKKAGLKTVVDLRMPTEGTEAEEAVAKELGLQYVPVPFTAASFSAADVAAVKKVLDDRDEAPVLVHCASGNRVGGVFAVLASQEGKTLDAAIAEGRRLGLHSAGMIDAVRRVTALDPPKEP
jgi:uncharacterized protein (TIGR01244 family)